MQNTSGAGGEERRLWFSPSSSRRDGIRRGNGVVPVHMPMGIPLLSIALSYSTTISSNVIPKSLERHLLVPSTPPYWVSYALFLSHTRVFSCFNCIPLVSNFCRNPIMPRFYTFFISYFYSFSRFRFLKEYGWLKKRGAREDWKLGIMRQAMEVIKERIGFLINTCQLKNKNEKL